MKEKILNSIHKDFVINGTFYDNTHIPNQISNAIYTFGDFSITDILAFIDTSDHQDGSHGMIITPECIYFQFGQAGQIKYNEITKLLLEKHHNTPTLKATVKFEKGGYAFGNKFIHPEIFIHFLSEITDVKVEMIMSNAEKVAHYVTIVLDDLINNEYEDVTLTFKQRMKVQEFYQNLAIINSYDEINYNYELQNLCTQTLTFFDELEIDSEEIDELNSIQQQIIQTNQEDQQIDNAKKYYDEMMDKYQHGDTSMIDQVKDAMNKLGIDESDLAGKSPDEIKSFLCLRFGISESMFDRFANKLKK